MSRLFTAKEIALEKEMDHLRDQVIMAYKKSLDQKVTECQLKRLIVEMIELVPGNLRGAYRNKFIEICQVHSHLDHPLPEQPSSQPD